MNDLIDIDQTMDLKARFVTKFSLKESTNQIEIEYILDDETWDSSIVEYKGKIGTLPTPSKKGFEFMGWYTEKDGTDKITEETIVDSVEKIKLYARWEKKTLEYLMVNSKTTTPNFNLPATTDETADGLYKMKDDYGVSYYFRDAASNNYVKFGKNANGQEMWWRIIRKNGDGSIRMQYDGTGAEGATTYTKGFALTEQVWNPTYNDAKYVGWMFGGSNGTASTSKEQAQRNETDSPIKTSVDNWYKTNIQDTGYSIYIKDAIFCNDRSTPGKSATDWPKDTGLGYGKNYTGYGTSSRIATEGAVHYNNTQPQFMCPQNNDKFTVNKENGNGALTYPVGLLTEDELVAAGGGHPDDKTNYSYYLYKNEAYWLFSPNCMYTAARVYFANGSSTGGTNGVFGYGQIAPVINFKAEYLEKLKGSGQISDPFHL